MDDIIQLQRARTQACTPGEHQEFQNIPYPADHVEVEHPKPNAGSAAQQHGGGGATRRRGVPAPQWDHGDDSNRFSVPPPAKNPWDDIPIRGSGKTGYNLDAAMAQAGEDPRDPPVQKAKIKYLSPAELQAELQREQQAKEEAAAAQAAADKEEDARLEAEAEKQRQEDAEMAERERAEAAARKAEEKANDVLNPVQQMELDSARDMLGGTLSAQDQKILAEGKAEFGDDFMEWGLAQTKKVLKRIILGA